MSLLLGAAERYQWLGYLEQHHLSPVYGPDSLCVDSLDILSKKRLTNPAESDILYITVKQTERANYV
jgi:hypothetical protein